MSHHSTFSKLFISELPLIQTRGRFEFHSHSNVRLPKNRDYWQVTVSVTTENDAYIVLCEGQDPFSSACYWIILGGWLKDKDGPRCVIRKCPYGVNRDGFPTGLCKNSVATKYVSINTKFEFMCGTVAVCVPGGYKLKRC